MELNWMWILLFIFIAVVAYLAWPKKSMMTQLTEEITAANL
jgi:tryptophan-rich sensory protein